MTDQSVAQRYKSLASKFNRMHAPDYSIVFDNDVENRANLHAFRGDGKEADTVGSMMFVQIGRTLCWKTMDGEHFESFSLAAEHMLEIKASPRWDDDRSPAEIGRDMHAAIEQAMEDESKVFTTDYAALEKRIIAHSGIAGIASIASMIGERFPGDEAHMIKEEVPQQMDFEIKRSYRNRGRRIKTRWGAKVSKAPRYKGSAQAKRANRTGGNHAKAKLARFG